MDKPTAERIALRSLWKADNIDEVVSVRVVEFDDDSISGDALCYVKGGNHPVRCEFGLYERFKNSWNFNYLNKVKY